MSETNFKVVQKSGNNAFDVVETSEPPTWDRWWPVFEDRAFAEQVCEELSAAAMGGYRKALDRRCSSAGAASASSCGATERLEEIKEAMEKGRFVARTWWGRTPTIEGRGHTPEGALESVEDKTGKRIYIRDLVTEKEEEAYCDPAIA